MGKQRNKRGKISKATYTQTIVEKPELKSGRANPRYPGTKIIVHRTPAKP